MLNLSNTGKIKTVNEIQIKNTKPCKESIDWFYKNGNTSSVSMVKQLEKEDNYKWANWVIINCLPMIDAVNYADYNFQLVSNIYSDIPEIKSVSDKLENFPIIEYNFKENIQILDTKIRDYENKDDSFIYALKSAWAMSLALRSNEPDVNTPQSTAFGLVLCVEFSIKSLSLYNNKDESIFYKDSIKFGLSLLDN